MLGPQTQHLLTYLQVVRAGDWIVRQIGRRSSSRPYH